MTDLEPNNANLNTSATLQRRGFLTLGFGALLASCAPVDAIAPDTNGQVPNGRPQSWAQVVSAPGFITTGPVHDRIRRIAGRVLPAPTKNPTWQFAISPDPRAIAYGAISNFIVVSQGLIALCENDGQIAAILAHRVALVQTANNVSGRSAMSAPLNDMSETSSQIVISQADAASIKALAKAGYDPRDAMEIWQNIGQTDPSSAATLAARLALMAGELGKMGYQV